MDKYAIELIDIFSNIVVYTKTITQNSDNLTYEDVSLKYSNIINDIENEIKIKKLGKYYKNTLVGYIAWIDEEIMLSKLSFKKQWMKNLLQKKYFQTSNLGNDFFTKYDNFTTDYKNEKIVFLYILCLGFKGKYLLNKNSLDNFIIKEMKEMKIDLKMDYFNKVYNNNNNIEKPVKKIQYLKINYLIGIIFISITCIAIMYLSLQTKLDDFFYGFK
jgi:hypothetical protein